MSKKSKKSSKKSNDKVRNERLIEAMFGNEDDYEGFDVSQNLEMTPKADKEVKKESPFMTLDTTDEGKKRMDDIKLRASKKTKTTPVEEVAEPEVEAKEEVKVNPWDNYDGSAISDILNKAIGFIKEGKFGKAYEDHDSKIISKFLELYDQIPKDDKKVAIFNGYVKDLLIICKSYYEYDDKHRQYISDNQYDKALSKFLACGNEEPVGISVGRNKTAIKYPTLHNNMNKAYVLRSADPIPNGVKETDSIEAFLIRVYKTLGLTSEAELKLEVSPKIDGVSINGTITNDLLKDPQSRGDYDESVAIKGMSGLQVGDMENISDKPFGIQYEAFVTVEDMIKASQYLSLATPYVSCRHAAAGITQRLSVKEDDGLLQFLSLYPINSEGLEGTYEERMDFIENFGIVPKDMIDRKIIKGTMKELIKKIEVLRDDYADKRSSLSYEIDGIVITVPDDDYQKAMGRNGRTNQYQIALKFDPETAEGHVHSIRLVAGHKGYRTIQVNMEKPVFIGGVRYDHVPVLSKALFDDMGLRKGSKIKVFRTGDVIPAIEVIEAGHGEKLHAPDTCPWCGKKLIVKAKKLYCDNISCQGNIMGRLVGYVKGIGVEGYDETAIQKMINEDDIFASSILDLYSLSNEKFHKALVEATETCPDYKILGSLGIPDLGPARAKMILKHCGGFMNIVKGYGINHQKNVTAGFETCTDATVSRILSKILTDSDTRCVMSNIAKYMKNFTTDFSDMIRVGHTGYTPSQTVIRICKENNFEIVDGKKFDMLITGDYSSKSGKMVHAIEKDIPIFTEETFVGRYGNTEERKQRYTFTKSVYDDGEEELDENDKPVMIKHDAYYERECDDKYGFIPA